ncbi:thioesterase [Streptomyces sp. AJS327]|uniref:thioesterase II family protein n=1 Tax=Streptomyces sp. AJS327 TaxID=2545265 RepID=UPI0015DFCE0C|nr:alpha/beta fold hydrolase [Streptomyces sp. AJS327]MBA0052240.1 thioesterase [Streptomyces sp. AJS327]
MNPLTGPAKDWLRRLNAGRTVREPAARLLCFPHGGGSANYFAPLARELPASLDVLGVQYPGRQDRRTEPVLDDVRELARRVTDVLAEQPPQPTVFLGHSLGAYVAFEVMHDLQRRSLPLPACLLVSSQGAPRAWRWRERAYELSDEVIVGHVRRMTRAELPELDDPEVLSVLLPVLRGDFKAADTYQATVEQRLSCPISCYLGEEDDYVRRQDTELWREETTGETRLKLFPGGHFYLDARIPEVAAAMTADIDEFLEAATPTGHGA